MPKPFCLLSSDDLQNKLEDGDDENPQDLSNMNKNELDGLSHSQKLEIEDLMDQLLRKKFQEERSHTKKQLEELELLITNDGDSQQVDSSDEDSRQDSSSDEDSQDDSDDEEKKLIGSKHISIVRKHKPSLVLGFKSLNYDTYTLMILSDEKINHGWLLGFIVFLFQLGLGILTIYSQQQDSESDFNDTILQIPIRTKAEVTILQLLSIFVAVYCQEDVFNAIALPIDLRLNGPHPWGRIPIEEEDKESRRAWMWKVLLPNIFKCVQGFIVLFASVIVILQSTEVIELLKDFTALYVISSIDDIIFSVARRGFFGTKLLQLAAEAEVTELSVDSRASNNVENQREIRWYRNGTFIKTIVLHIILLLSILSWLLVLIFQENGMIAKQKYPLCMDAAPSFKSKWKQLENGICNMEFNHPECAYDGRDCSEFNQIYPGCRVDDITLLGNGKCDGQPYDSKVCRYDGGDCSIEDVIKAKYPLCENASPSFRGNWSQVENGVCDMIFNIPECGMDGGDCLNFNMFYPGCNELKDAQRMDASKIGDGVCDGYPYNSIECKRDGGDCREDAIYCDSSLKGEIGDGQCDSELNVWKCHFDRGDCIIFDDDFYFFQTTPGNGICEGIKEIRFRNDFDGGDCIHPGYEGCWFLSDYPNFVDEINDEKCHNTKAHNRKRCGYDGGACIEFNQKYPNCTEIEAWRIGDGICDVEFNTTECGFDEGDCCENSKKDGRCEQKYNTEECRWDKGDCLEFNEKYPGCKVFSPIMVGNGKCDAYLMYYEMMVECFGSSDAECFKRYDYNSLECGWDGGDCDVYNTLSDCPYFQSYDDILSLGDGNCNPNTNTKECGWDAGDCIEKNNWVRSKYPDCNNGTVTDPDKLGNKKCDREFNTKECGWDDGDCSKFNMHFPNCTYPFQSKVGDGNCVSWNSTSWEGEILSPNITECGWDGGDCDESFPYPDCRKTRFWVGDGECDAEVNIAECNFDGGDCEEKNEKLWSMYPDCDMGVDPDEIGNNECNLEWPYNTHFCGWDGGDCIESNKKNPELCLYCKIEQFMEYDETNIDSYFVSDDVDPNFYTVPDEYDDDY